MNGNNNLNPVKQPNGMRKVTNSSTAICRWYTLTVKPCANQFKGNSKLLFDTYLRVVHDMKQDYFEYNIEDKGTTNEHIHALVSCPYINNKLTISTHPKYKGFSIRFAVIRKEDEQDTIHLWERYVTKETTSDSQNYYKQYGNMFIPEL